MLNMDMCPTHTQTPLTLKGFTHGNEGLKQEKREERGRTN